MNWTHRRPFRHQLNSIQKLPLNRHVSKPLRSEQPIDAIRLQLADYTQTCPIHHPHITTLSDQQSSIRRTRSSIQSISTIETDFVHQRVSTIHTYPTSPSIIEQEQILNENIDSCRNCTMLVDIVEQQAQQIRQYTEQISQQTDLLARLARHLADLESESNQTT